MLIPILFIIFATKFSTNNGNEGNSKRPLTIRASAIARRI